MLVAENQAASRERARASRAPGEFAEIHRGSRGQPEPIPVGCHRAEDNNRNHAGRGQPDGPRLAGFAGQEDQGHDGENEDHAF